MSATSSDTTAELLARVRAGLPLREAAHSPHRGPHHRWRTGRCTPSTAAGAYRGRRAAAPNAPDAEQDAQDGPGAVTARG
ncbi:hypothetical protein [Thermobifida cellulosilytica]|uniref:Uncharacterized protein n=1 Tax=Thermobifida cellulosilytica TB100 TaxID=665004 RepID=A0A147KD68_THECS|nr:hypothetical protein [Thermobifida cellulosilytica]KUP95246.1 hypothetical protein AC529_18905 [Thermobifida cellulosilytica TB100]